MFNKQIINKYNSASRNNIYITDYIYTHTHTHTFIATSETGYNIYTKECKCEYD